MKKIVALALVSVLILSLFSGCGSVAGQTDSSTVSTVSGPDKITLSGNTARYSGKGVVINGNVITIYNGTEEVCSAGEEGPYRPSGGNDEPYRVREGYRYGEF